MIGSPSLRERLRGARRLLLGRGEDATICSFCARDRHETGCDIVAGPGVAICSYCAGIALDWAVTQQIGPVPEGRSADTFPLFDFPASLLAAHRARLGEDLSACARELSCDLVSWGYFCRDGRGADGVTVHLHIPAGANVGILRGTFLGLYFGLAPE